MMSQPEPIRCSPRTDRRVRAMAEAMAPWIADPGWRLDVARNVATVLLCDEATGTPVNVVGVAVEALLHREQHFGLCCEDVGACALAMARAWDGRR